MSHYPSVRITSNHASTLPRSSARPARNQERSYALMLAFLTLASTATAFYDLFLLATSAG